MGTELALHLVDNHELRVWNRTEEKTKALVKGAEERGASVEVVSDIAEAIQGADCVISSLFGPDTVRDVLLEPGVIPAQMTWVDTTTVSPADAAEFAEAAEGYVHVPVVGTLGPARNGMLGVYVGCGDEQRRNEVLELVSPWADPKRLIGVDSAAKAATAKLLANLALAVSAEGLREALLLAESTGMDADEALELLSFTGLQFIRDMKAPFVRGERDTVPGDFTVDAIAKDARLMIATCDEDLPALRAALGSLTLEQTRGRGDSDFSSILVHRHDL